MSRLSHYFNFKTLFWIFFYLLVFFLLLNHSFSFLDPDLGWHLQVGRQIVATHEVPQINYYNYTFTGHWVDHEWLSNVGLYWAYNHLGYIALNIIFSLIIVLAFALANWYLFKVYPDINPGISVFLQLAGLAAAVPHFGVRIQELGVLFLVVFLIIIGEYERRRDWRLLLILPLFIYLWSNLHASFLIALFLGAAWLVIKSIERYLFQLSDGWLGKIKKYLRFKEVLKKREIFWFFCAWLGSFGVTFLTPYHASLYRFLFGYRNTFYLSHIQEWLSQFHIPLQYFQLLYLASAVIVIILVGFYLKSKKEFRLSLWEIFILILFIGLAFRSRRNFPLMLVATFGIVAVLWYEVLRDASIVGLPGHRLELNQWLKVYLISCLVLVSASLALTTNFIVDPFQSFCRNYPCAATRFLKDHPADNSLRLFNEYTWGGYLIWTYPERKIFIDGRLPQVAWQGQTFLKNYYDFFNKGASFAAKLKRYNIGLVLLPSSDSNLNLAAWEMAFFSINNQDLIAHNYLRDWLARSPNWHLVFQDKTAVIYQRLK